MGGTSQREFAQALEDWSKLAHEWFANWLNVWTLGQFAIIGLAAVATYLITLRVMPAAEAWVRARNTQSLNTMRLYAVLLRRIPSVIFLLLLTAALVAMRIGTWESRSYIVLLACKLTLIWIVMRLAARLIRNRLVASIFIWVGWIWASLVVLDLAPRAIQLLDALAIQIGSLRLSVLMVLQSALLVMVLTWFAGLAGTIIERRLANIEGTSEAMQVLIGKIVKIVLFTLAIVIALQTVGVDLSALAIFSGAIGLGLGFGLQKVVSNLISGIILLADRSVKPGDVISVDKTYGVITGLGARYVKVSARDGRDYLIPNETLITNQVINWTYTGQSTRIDVNFGVSYDADPHQVRKLAVGAARKVARVMPHPDPVCHLKAFGDSSLDFVLRFWIDDGRKGVVNVQGEVLLALWDALKEANIEIPFPQREVMIKRAQPGRS